MRKAIVLGGCGFVGRHLTKRLMEDHCHVTAVDNLSSGLHPSDWPEDIYHDIYPTRLVIEDCRDFFRYAEASEFDEVYHCAAVVGGRLKIENDPLAVATDLAVDSDFFRWCVAGRPPRRVVYFSSSAVYPVELQSHTSNVALSESLVDFRRWRIGMPDQTYGWSKLTGELLAKYAVEKYKLNVHVFRPFSGYGPDQDFTYPFSSIIQRVLNRESPLVVWGSGHQERDFIFIDDVVDIVMATADQPAGLTLNLGTGVATSFLQLATTAWDTLGIVGYRDITNDPTKPEGVFSRVCDPTLLHHLGHKSKITLQEGIRRVAAHLDKARGRM